MRQIETMQAAFRIKKIYVLFLAFTILAGCTGSDEVKMIEPPESTISHIIESVRFGDSDYIGKTVKINGIVERAANEFTPNPTAENQITIETGTGEVEFFILGEKAVNQLIEPNKPINEYKKGLSYDFYVFISRVVPHEYISNSHRIVSYLIVDEIDISIDILVSDVRLKNREHKYISNIIHLIGGVEVIDESKIIKPGVPDLELPEKKYLKTKYSNVYFIVDDYTAPANNIYKFKDGVHYDLVLFIRSIDEDPIRCPRICYDINSIIVWDQISR